MAGWRCGGRGPGDEDTLRAIRLEAVGADPSAFGSTLARERAFGPEDWARRLGPPGATWVVGDPPRAMAWASPAADDPTRVGLYGMWVAPERRGTGAADALVAAVVGVATERAAHRVVLTVVVGNVAAERVYRRHGFVPTGVGHLGDDGQVEAEMVLPL